MEARNLAIMLTDIKGFTSKTAGFSRAQTQDLLKRHHSLVMPVIVKFGGRLVKTIGDAFLVVFNSPTDAVICGVEIQDVLKAYNEGKDHAGKIEIRIAINSGEVAVHEDGDIYGDPVNITSRLESIAEAGEVFFTEAVYLAMNKKEVPSSEIGYRQFKGIPEKIKVFRVLREVPVGAQPPGEPPAETPVERHPAAAAPAGQAAAGFWRRLGSLLADLAIFLIILNTFGLNACKSDVKVKGQRPSQLEGMAVKDISLSKQGLQISGEAGEKIVIGKDGTKLTGRDGRPIAVGTAESEPERGGENTGENKKKVPLNMLIWALYGSVLVWRFGATPGMKIFKLKAVDFTTGGPLPADRAFLRAFFALVSLSGAMLGYAWAIWEKDRRTWHDLIAGSRVIKL